MGFSRQEYWSGLPFPSPGDLPNPGTEPMSPTLSAVSLPLSHHGSPLEMYTPRKCSLYSTSTIFNIRALQSNSLPSFYICINWTLREVNLRSRRWVGTVSFGFLQSYAIPNNRGSLFGVRAGHHHAKAYSKCLFFFSSSVLHQDFLVPTNYTCPRIVFFFLISLMPFMERKVL